MILVATFAAIEMLWFSIYALGGQTLAQNLTRPALRRAFDRITGGIFMGLALRCLPRETEPAGPNDEKATTPMAR